MTPRSPRLYDSGYLAWLRKKPCCVCGRGAPSEAAHVRYSDASAGKVNPGMQQKSDDRFAVPLCAWCHRGGPESQHNTGDERLFWDRLEIDPIALAAKLYAQYGGTGGKPKPRTIIKPRLPDSKRQKIPARKNPWPKRTFRSA